MDLYDRLIAWLDAHSARYRTVDHAPEGRTDVISGIRKNRLSQAAKALVVQATGNDTTPTYWLVVVPGDRRIDFGKVRQVTESRQATLAAPDEARRLTAAEIGAIPPFSFRPDLGLIVDERLCTEDEIVFNAGRLDRSLFLVTEDYLRIAQPQVRSVAD